MSKIPAKLHHWSDGAPIELDVGEWDGTLNRFDVGDGRTYLFSLEAAEQLYQFSINPQGEGIELHLQLAFGEIEEACLRVVFFDSILDTLHGFDLITNHSKIHLEKEDFQRLALELLSLFSPTLKEERDEELQIKPKRIVDEGCGSHH